MDIIPLLTSLKIYNTSIHHARTDTTTTGTISQTDIQNIEQSWTSTETKPHQSSYLICSNDGLNSQMVVNHLDITLSDSLSDCSSSCWNSCYGHRPCTNSRWLTTRSDSGRWHIRRARRCTVTCIAKEYIPRLSTKTDHFVQIHRMIQMT